MMPLAAQILGGFALVCVFIGLWGFVITTVIPEIFGRYSDATDIFLGLICLGGALAATVFMGVLFFGVVLGMAL